MVCAVLLGLILGAARSAAADKDVKADKLFETAYSAYKLERWEDAATKFYDFMAAAPYDPRNDRAQYYVGRCFMHRKYLNKAIKEFTYLIKDFPKSTYTELGLHYRAQCYLKTREKEKAIEDMERVIARPVEHRWRWSKKPMEKQLNSNHRHDVFWLAKHYMQQKSHQAAISAYQKLPRQMEAFHRVVDVYYKLGQFDKIKRLIDELGQKNKHAAFKYMIEFYGKKKAYNQLKDIFAKLLQDKNPNRKTDDLVWTTANSFRNFGWDRWEEAMQMVSQHYPRMARKADYHLARRKWKSMAYQDKLELFVIKYREGDDVDDVLRWKGITLERHGKAEEARKDYRRMGDAGQGHWFAAETYHGRYAKKKDLEAAIKTYTELRKSFYSQQWSAMAQWRIATLYRQMDKIDEAVEAYRHIAKRWPALKIKKNHRDHWYHVLKNNLGKHHIFFAPAALLQLGNTLREAGRYRDGIMEYRNLVRKYPKTEEGSLGAYYTGLCFEGMTDREMAVKVFKSVLRRYPKTSAASDAHTRLETKYDIADTEVSDEVDFFSETEDSEKDYLEDPTKLRK